VSGGAEIGSFHVHRGHAFGGFRIEEQQGRAVLVADCACGELLGVADAVPSRSRVPVRIARRVTRRGVGRVVELVNAAMAVV
jgi:hypothetical protein